MNKDSDILKCPVCLDQYNLNEKLPRLLPQCGHTVCCECLTTLLKAYSPKCPLDMACCIEDFVEIDQYPTNFSLRSILEEDEKWDVCPTHNAKLDVICLEDKVRICPFCALFSEHKGHELRYLNEVQEKVNEKRKEIDTAVKARENVQREAETMIDEKRQELLKVIEDKYEAIYACIDGAKEKLIDEFESFFYKQREKLKEIFQGDALVVSTLNAKSASLRDFAKKKDPFSDVEEDVTGLISQLATASLQKPVQRFSDQISEVWMRLNSILSVQTSFLKEVETPFKKFSEMTNLILNENLKDDSGSQSAQIGGLSLFEVIAPFKVEICDGVFNVTTLRSNNENIKVNVDEWKKIKEAVFTLDQYPFVQKDSTSLNVMWNILEGLSSVKFNVQTQFNLSDSNVLKLLPTLFTRSKKLEEISIDFGSNKVANDCVELALELLAPYVGSLKHLSLGLLKTGVKDATIEKFISNILNKCKKLETFKIDLGLTKISEQTVTKMFIQLPSLRKLELGLNGLDITDRVLEILSKDISENLEGLEDLEMKLWMSKVTDEGLSMLFNSVRDIKRLALNLVGTSVTDKSVGMLVSSIGENMKSLKDLDLFLWSTGVSEGIKGQIEEIKRERAH